MVSRPVMFNGVSMQLAPFEPRETDGTVILLEIPEFPKLLPSPGKSQEMGHPLSSGIIVDCLTRELALRGAELVSARRSTHRDSADLSFVFWFPEGRYESRQVRISTWCLAASLVDWALAHAALDVLGQEIVQP